MSGSRTVRVARGEKIHGMATSRARFFVATTTGFEYRTRRDRCRSFRTTRRNTVQAICRHPGPPSLLFAASYNSIIASADGGRTWRRMATDGWPV